MTPRVNLNSSRAPPLQTGRDMACWRRTGGDTPGKLIRIKRRNVMAVSIRQLHDVFFGEVSGVDITKPLGRDEVAAIEAGMDRYAVLVFHGQDITDEQQKAFSRNFGPLEDARGGNVTKPQDKRLGDGMNDVSNLGKDGKPLPRDS